MAFIFQQNLRHGTDGAYGGQTERRTSAHIKFIKRLPGCAHLSHNERLRKIGLECLAIRLLKYTKRQAVARI